MRSKRETDKIDIKARRPTEFFFIFFFKRPHAINWNLRLLLSEGWVEKGFFFLFKTKVCGIHVQRKRSLIDEQQQSYKRHRQTTSLIFLSDYTPPEYVTYNSTSQQLLTVLLRSKFRHLTAG
jgi:hypothetical protein